jgi:DNA-binding winged helix-turn-helix (wHTH) protein
MDAVLPELDEFDILRRGSRWAALAPIEARIIEVFLERSGRVVRRSEFSAVWPHGMPAPRALDARLVLLRDRIAPLGIRIRTVRARGFLLDVAPIGDAPPS